MIVKCMSSFMLVVLSAMVYIQTRPSHDTIFLTSYFLGVLSYIF